MFIYLFISLLVIHFIHISVYMSIPISQFITPPPPPTTFPPWCPYVCSKELMFLNFRPIDQFVLLGIMLGIISKKSLPSQRSQGFSPMFSIKSCIFLGFKFRSIIRFWVDFCICIQKSNYCSTFCWKAYLFSLHLFVPLSKINSPPFFYIFGYQLLLSITPIPQCFDYDSFIISLEIT